MVSIHVAASVWFVTFWSLLVLPSLLSDIDKRMESWGKEGKMDPFKKIYDVCGRWNSFLIETI